MSIIRETDATLMEGPVAPGHQALPSLALDSDARMFQRAARSMAAAVAARVVDNETPTNARSRLRPSRSLWIRSAEETRQICERFLKSLMPTAIKNNWSNDETRRFVFGVIHYGNDFDVIRKEVLPHREIPEIAHLFHSYMNEAMKNRERSLLRSQSEEDHDLTRARPSSSPKESDD